jgi:hypothetical protein
MTSAILNHPLRAPPPSDTPIAISYIGPIATGQFADAQTNCQFLSMTGDATTSVLSSTMSDKFGNMTLPGLAAFVKASETCKYLRDVGRHVATPIDAKVIDLSYVINVAGEQNLNRQRFVLRALQKDNGLPAGARFRLTSEPVNATPTADEEPTDPFLLAYRDCRSYHDRPVVLAIAKPVVNGHLLCVEISIREMLIFFGGYSKRSAFTASRCPALGLARWQYNPKCTDSAISVWGDSSAYVSLVDEDDLKADSVNPIDITATPKGTNNGFVMSQGRSTRGGVSHSLSLDVKFRFPSSTCLAFSDAVFTLEQPGLVASFFGCFESAATACIPSYKGAMIAAAQRLERPLRQVSRKARQDTGKISMANVTTGRRAAVKLCDLTLQRLATEDELMHDGGFLPGHPMYRKIKEELDEMNELLAEQGKPPVSDSRLAELPPSPKRVRRTYLTIE